MGFGRGFGNDMPKPVKVGDELDVTIEAVAAKGDGIAKKEGFVIFVPGTAVGENCKIRITAVKASSAVAEKV
jgi:predicted RNA-binding protein with TRAM domain